MMYRFVTAMVAALATAALGCDGHAEKTAQANGPPGATATGQTGRSPAVSPSPAPEIPPDYVSFPGVWVHPSCAHEVPLVR